MKKRILFLVLIVAALCAVFALTASAATTIDSGTCGTNVTWTLDSEGTLTISGTGEMQGIAPSPWSNYNNIIKKVVIGDGITSIGSFSFQKFSSLASVNIPHSVTSIGYSAFSGCTSLTSVTIPDSVTSIDIYAFRDCTSLTSVAIPNRVTTIGDDAFSRCTSLTKIEVDINNTAYKSDDYGALLTKDGTALIQYPAASSNTVYTVSVGVRSIGNYAFYNCTSLTKITIPDSVTNIGNAAFYNCTSLTAIELPDNILQIPDSMTLDAGFFENCSSLQNVVLPENLFYLGTDAFQNCSALTSVIIPNSVVSIGDSAFYGCSALASITIGSSVTSIGLGAFFCCSALTSVTIPDSVVGIGSRSFYGCSALTSVIIPNSVTNIDNQAFLGCGSYFTIFGYKSSAAETYAVNSGQTFVALDGNALAPTITRQPLGTNGWNTSTYYAGDSATPLTVEAFAYADGTLTYTWYKADSADGEGVKVSDTASCTPDVVTVGTTYYYAVVTNTWTNINNITTTASTKSNVITVTVNSISPTIQFQTSGTVNCYPGSSTPTLFVSATYGINSNLSYAWYKADSADGEGVKVGEASTHLPDTTTAGTYYYYAVVTNTRTNNAGVTVTAETKSAVITVIVHARSTLTGSYTSYDPDAPARIELLQNGMIVMNQYSPSLGTGSGQATQNFTFTITTPGTYDLRIVKGGHLTVTITGITVDGTSNITLDPITLPCGDVNGDGAINVADVALLRLADNYGKSTDDLVFTFGG